MAKEYYECHITVDPELDLPDRRRLVLRAAIDNSGWTFSEIHNDIVLGKGAKLYATKHFNVSKLTIEQVWQTMLETKAYWEATFLMNILRMKIEVVVKDERYDNG